MPTAPKPNLDDLFLATAKFLTCLDRADADVRQDLRDRVSQKRGPEDPLVALVYQALSRRRLGVGHEEHDRACYGRMVSIAALSSAIRASSSALKFVSGL